MKHSFDMKKIGIWGYGRVGQSAVRFFDQYRCTIGIFDDRQLTPLEITSLPAKATIYPPADCASFLADHDLILASPGVNLTPHLNEIASKLIGELDIFAEQFKKPTIAITGSIGKTSCTHLTGLLLEKYKHTPIIGGNIGTPLLDLVHRDGSVGVLELSSFQLEHSRFFAPDIAVLTNFYPNHLDRHGTEENYLAAKLNLFAHQQAARQALIPFELRDRLNTMNGQAKRTFFTAHDVSDEQQSSLGTSAVFFVRDNIIQKYSHYANRLLVTIADLPRITFAVNWVIIVAILDALGLDCSMLPALAKDLYLPEHRMEFIGTIKGVSFYNDSKATTPASTLAAVNRLNHAKTLLFIGGLSKGIDRRPFIGALKGKVKHLFAFGAEADALATFAHEFQIPCTPFKSLDEAFSSCISMMRPDDTVLFSPSGSSFDLFENYEKRGACFKKMVSSLLTK